MEKLRAARSGRPLARSGGVGRGEAGRLVADQASNRVLPPQAQEEHGAGDDGACESIVVWIGALLFQAVSRRSIGRTRFRPPSCIRVADTLAKSEGEISSYMPVLATTYTGSIQGVEGLLVRVEVDLTKGITSFRTVGLPDTSVREAEVRVRSALTNSGFDFPQCRVTVNLAPADVRKQGTAYDLAVALGVVAAMRQGPAERLTKTLFLGELALDGSLRPVRGVLPIVAEASRRGLAERSARSSESWVTCEPWRSARSPDR
jgi:hypothetical protein